MDVILNYTAIKLGVLCAAAFAAIWISSLAVFAVSMPIKVKVSIDFSACFSLIFSSAIWLLPFALEEFSDNIPDEVFWVEIAAVFAAAALYVKYRLSCGWKDALILMAAFALSQGAVYAYLKINILNQSI